jgi:hypothetical protein
MIEYPSHSQDENRLLKNQEKGPEERTGNRIHQDGRPEAEQTINSLLAIVEADT